MSGLLLTEALCNGTMRTQPQQGSKAFVVAPASIEDTVLPTAAKVAAVLGASMLMVLAYQRMRQHSPGDARDDPAEAYSRRALCTASCRWSAILAVPAPTLSANV